MTTPGEFVDLFVTERGIAVNPLRKDLEEKLNEADIPTTSIHWLNEMAGERAGTVIDVIRQQK